MDGDNYFLQKKKPIGDDHHQRLLSRIFQVKFSAAAIVDHQQEFSHDDDHNHIFLSKVDDSHDDDDDDDEDDDGNNPQERTIFWESQEFLLQEVLDQCNSTGSKLREEIMGNIAIVRESKFCNCMVKKLRVCSKCLRQAAVDQLCSKGFNAALCTSKWKKTHKIPGGSHQYVEVVVCTKGRRKQIPFLVELGFRDEFRMAKACDEYNKLIDLLPEIYTGKLEHLNALVRVVCEAAKRSAKEKKIYMGPWRSTDFMHMKWSASQRRFFEYPSDKLWANPSVTQESLNVVTSNFQLPMASTVRVA